MRLLWALTKGPPMSGKSFKAHGCSFVVVAAQMCMQNVVENYIVRLCWYKRGATYSPRRQNLESQEPLWVRIDRLLPPTSTMDVVTLYPLFLHNDI